MCHKCNPMNVFKKYLTAEQKEHIVICKYLAIKYPNLLWWHTPNESKKTPFERFLFSEMGGKAGVSDFIILEPNSKYKGLFIELKASNKKIFKKDGSCYYESQNKFIKQCNERGFFACFAVGYEDAINIIENYLKIK